MNLAQIDRDFDTDDKCMAFLERLRWPDGVKCINSECRSDRISRVQAVARGRTERTNGRTYTRKLYECMACGEQFSVKSGTLFHDSHLPLRTWFKAIVLVCQSKKGQSANQVGRTIGVSYKTAWYLCHRIREAMLAGTLPLGGQIEMDEKYLGGKVYGKGVKAGYDNKECVVGVKQRGGELRLVHTQDAKAKTLRDIANKHLSDAVEIVMTDEFVSYPFAFRGTPLAAKHHTVRHKTGEYVRGIVHTNSVESAFSLLQRGLVGSFHQLSVKHLRRYLQEFEYRHNNRKNPAMFEDVLKNSAKRGPLTFRALTARAS